MNVSMKKKRSRKRGIKGHGDYTDAVSAIVSPLPRIEAKIDHLEKALVKKSQVPAAAAKVGRVLGNFINQGDLGEMAGSAMAKLFGHGDYNIVSNSLIKSANVSGAKFATEGRGVRIAEREYIGNVVSLAGVFNNTSYTINPTNPVTFPWLSTMAPLFDQWDPHGIVFEYVSTSSEFNGYGQALGSVIMATEYNPYDAAYASKVIMENSDYSCSTKPSQGLLHGVECAVSERPTKVLYTNTATGAPKTSTILGVFQLATQGTATAATLGELWVSYDITLYKKAVSTTASILSSPPSWEATGNTGALQSYLANPSVTFSNVITVDGITGIVSFNNTLVGNRYIFTYYGTSEAVVIPVLTGCTIVSSRIAGTAATPWMTTFLFVTTAPSATFQVALVTAIVLQYSAYITQVNSSFVAF